MSAERDELARLMYVADNANQPEAESLRDWGTYLAGSTRDVYTHRMADAILAAGYRKPRIITTTEELDGLAEGSVILSNGGEDSAQKDGEGYWYLWGGDTGLCPEEIVLPATVLHNPDESA